MPPALSTSALLVGMDAISASYGGGGVYAASPASPAVTVTIAPLPPLTLGPLSRTSTGVGVPFRAAVSATGGVGAPYTVALAIGSTMPPGLALAADGTLSGTPTAAGSYGFTIAVTDSAMTTPATRAYTLLVGVPNVEPTRAATGAPAGNTPQVQPMTHPTIGPAGSAVMSQPIRH